MQPVQANQQLLDHNDAILRKEKSRKPVPGRVSTQIMLWQCDAFCYQRYGGAKSNSLQKFIRSATTSNWQQNTKRASLDIKLKYSWSIYNGANGGISTKCKQTIDSWRLARQTVLQTFKCRSICMRTRANSLSDRFLPQEKYSRKVA